MPATSSFSDPQRLVILTDLRRAAGLNLSEMARRCGLRGKQSHQTAGAWERGVYAPSERRRPHMIGYLWDDLMLRTNPEQFEAVWGILEEEWGWAPIDDQEWQSFTTQARPGQAEPEDARSPFQAPVAPASFVGRTEELSTIHQLLDAHRPQPVALIGMGGIGKTTMAAYCARELREHFVDGVLWAHTQVSDPIDILNSWARAFGHDYSALADVQSRAAAMRNLLAGKEVLIVLDDVSNPSRVRPLLPSQADAAVLLTTRSEDVATAIGAHILRLPELGLEQSLALLAGLLGQPRLDAEPDEAVAICSLLHHLPLAIEIVGQLLAARPRRRLVDMAQRLLGAQARLDLAIADRDVRTSFLVSWDSLDDLHRQAFAHMALFEGRSFTAEALASVLQIAPMIAADRLDMLAARSLVSLAEENRYRQHPLLADFAREQLGDAPDAWMRLAVTQLAFARDCEGDQTRLGVEMDNIMAAMHVAVDSRAYQIVLDYADVLTDPWLTGARYGQARQGYDWAVDAAQAHGNLNAHCFFLCKWGRACFEQDDYDEAAHHFGAAQKIAHSVGNRSIRAESAFWIGRIALEKGEYARADRFLDESEAIYRALEEPGGLALVFYQQAQLCYDRGDLEATEALCRRALDMEGARVDPTIQAATLRLLADVDIESGAYAAAAKHCEQALALCERLQSRAELAATYYSLAVVARMQDRQAEALQYAEQSLSLCETLGLRAFGALVLYEQSRIYALLNQADQAYRLCEESVSSFRELGRTYNLVLALNHLGQICLTLDRIEDAHQHWRDALTMAEHLAHPLVDEIRTRLAALST